MSSSKPNKNNNNNNWFTGQPERKRQRLENAFDNMDDDDALFAGDAMEEIEMFATQMENQSQMENEEPQGFFEQYAANGGNMSSAKDDKRLKKQVEELKANNEQKSGENLLLREKLAEVERILQKERDEKYAIEKEKKKSEERLKADILKTKEKYEDQLGFSRKELDEANGRIKNLENSNKTLRSEVAASNDEETQKTPGTSSSHRIKIVKVKSPKPNQSRPQGGIDKPRPSLLGGDDEDPPDSWWIQHYGKTKAERDEQVNSFWNACRSSSQKMSYSTQGSFRQVCEQLQSQYPKDKFEDFYKKIEEAKGASGDLLRTLHKETYTDEYKLMLAIPFFEFFPVYVDKCCGYLSSIEEKNLRQVLFQMCHTCQDCPKVKEHVLKNMQPTLDALFELCRNSKVEEDAFSALFHLYYETPPKYVAKLVPFLSSGKPPFSRHFVILSEFVVVDKKALLQLIRPEPEPPVPKLYDDEEDDKNTQPDFLQQLQDTYDHSQHSREVTETYKNTCRKMCTGFLTNVTWRHSDIFVDYPDLIGKIETFTNHIMRDEIWLDRETWADGGIGRYRMIPLWNMVHMMLPVFNDCLPKSMRYSNIDPGYLIDIKERLYQMEDPDRFIIESRGMLKDILEGPWK